MGEGLVEKEMYRRRSGIQGNVWEKIWHRRSMFVLELQTSHKHNYPNRAKNFPHFFCTYLNSSSPVEYFLICLFFLKYKNMG